MRLYTSSEGQSLVQEHRASAAKIRIWNCYLERIERVCDGGAEGERAHAHAQLNRPDLATHAAELQVIKDPGTFKRPTKSS